MAHFLHGIIPNMHEMSVAQNILEIVGQSLPDRRTPVLSIKLRLGQMSGIVKDSLEFCFGVITEGTPFAGACLDIEDVPVRAECRGCGAVSALDYGMFICPACGSNDLKMVSGTELQVVSLLLADEKETQ
jgi:hydrogenase nickel incorporation protein HypA/HybF